MVGKCDLYIGSIFLATLLFVCCIRNPDLLHFKISEWIGGKLYVLMYILHVLVMNIINVHIGFLNPIIIFVVTAIVSSIIYIFIDYLKNS